MPFWKSIDFLSVGGFAITVISTILAIVFYCRGKAKKSLVYQISTSDLITDKINSTPGIKISVGDEPAVKVSSTTIIFTNNGNQTINSSDFSSLFPLQVFVAGHIFNAKNIDESYINTRVKTLNPKIEVVKDYKIVIKFEYLKPKQKFEITVLHDGILVVDGDLKTGTLQNYNPEEESISLPKKRTLNKIFSNLAVTLPVVLLLFSLFLGFFGGTFRDNRNSSDESDNVNIQMKIYKLEYMVENLQVKVNELEMENQRLQDVIDSLYPE